MEKHFTLTFKSDKICFLKTSIFTFIHIGISIRQKTSVLQKNRLFLEITKRTLLNL